MKTVLITGSEGFMGRNLSVALGRKMEIRTLAYDVGTTEHCLENALREADILVHLAGVNRPNDPSEFGRSNAGLTKTIVDILVAQGRNPLIIFASSTQAVLDNPYGVSKRDAEECLAAYAQRSNTAVRVFRLPGVFGKWCRPNYNSVVATFCYNVAHRMDIAISDPAKEIQLAYIDDVVGAFVSLIDSGDLRPGLTFESMSPVYNVTLGQLAEMIRGFKRSRETLFIPDSEDRFTRLLYATYLSYLPKNDFAYTPGVRSDDRGTLSELLKSPRFGQIFVSRTLPGITRGNHYHDTKIEKFCVLEGDAIIRFRHIQGVEVLEYRVSGREIKIVDIPPGYTHSIENVGEGEMVVLFWANEIFGPKSPDTYSCEVKNG